MRWRVAVTVVALLVALASMGTVAPNSAAQAHNVAYGWWKCTQAYRTSYNPVYVGVDGTTYAFPPVRYGDGVANSFVDRIAEAASRYNGTVLNQVGRPYGVGFAGTNPAVSVQIQYRETPSATYIGWTNVDSSCTATHATSVPIPLFVEIWVDPRSDWFTQDDSRRTLWEACPSTGAPAYTCSKQLDVGGVVMHEIGHALGVTHPAATDQHIGSGSVAQILAQCGTFSAATMCPALKWRSNGRTLENWDVFSLQYALQ